MEFGQLDFGQAGVEVGGVQQHLREEVHLFYFGQEDRVRLLGHLNQQSLLLYQPTGTPTNQTPLSNNHLVTLKQPPCHSETTNLSTDS